MSRIADNQWLESLSTMHPRFSQKLDLNQYLWTSIQLLKYTSNTLPVVGARLYLSESRTMAKITISFILLASALTAYAAVPLYGQCGGIGYSAWKRIVLAKAVPNHEPCSW